MKLYLTSLLLLFSLIISAQEIENRTISKVWTLQECINYAVENNITIKTAELTKETADVTYNQSKLERLPNLTGNASQSLTNGTSIDPITSAFVSQKIYSTSASLNTSVNLFKGNQINNQIKQNKLLVDQNSFYVEEAKNNIVLSVMEAYIQALYAKEGIAIAEKNLDTSDQEAERTKARFEAGSIAMQDYSDAVSQAATNKYNLIAAKNNYDQQLLTLKQLLEFKASQELEIDFSSTENYTGSIIPNKLDVYETALEKLPEIQAARLDKSISEKDLDIAKGAYLPTLALTGSLGSGYTNTQDMTFVNQFDVNFNQRVGLTLSIPIFNKNQTKAQVQKAKISIQKAELTKSTAEKELYKKIETAWQNAMASQEQLNASKIASNAAEESYKLAQKKHELGALSTTDLIASQNTFTNAQHNYIQAKYLNILYNQLIEFYHGNQIKI